MPDYIEDMEKLRDTIEKGREEESVEKAKEIKKKVKETGDPGKITPIIELLDDVIDQVRHNPYLAKLNVQRHLATIKSNLNEDGEIQDRGGSGGASEFKVEGPVGGSDRDTVEFEEGRDEDVVFLKDEIERLQKGLAELEKDFYSEKRD